MRAAEHNWDVEQHKTQETDATPFMSETSRLQTPPAYRRDSEHARIKLV